ncbi:hypothetical protein [Limosilactobacillus mucosae]|uniref:Uncharacterized protein n=1 Tax=Limosilactobacillus mucosae TaxID=97478 RepID=A0AAJ1HTU5_LIMMU|nr:hypothetical protein [Limosilactobacillus mucosae]MDC2828435.1 hypothetical protein [Limosilactobacillus mucosae]MDC2834333.1 hypothetical protein [Limosilactobacillus mucosae]
MDNVISFRSQIFAENLAKLMEKNAETPLELGVAIEEENATVMAWLSGNVPSTDKLIKLQKHYHVSSATLLQPAKDPDNSDMIEEIVAHLDNELSEPEKLLIINYIDSLKKLR